MLSIFMKILEKLNIDPKVHNSRKILNSHYTYISLKYNNKYVRSMQVNKIRRTLS